MSTESIVCKTDAVAYGMALAAAN